MLGRFEAPDRICIGFALYFIINQDKLIQAYRQDMQTLAAVGRHADLL